MDKALLSTFKKLLGAGILSLSGVFSGFFKSVVWYIVKILVWLVDGIEGVVTNLYDYNTFFSSEKVTSFIKDWNPILESILAISIAILGLKLILKRQENRKELPMNILISILVVLGLSTFMIKLNDVTKLGVHATGISSDVTAIDFVKQYTTDVYTLDKKGYDEIKYGINDIGDNIDEIDITEEVDTDNISKENRDLYKYKLVNGKEKKLNKGFLGICEENYYRYVVDWIPLIVSLIALGISLVCVAIKISKLIIELAFNNLFATLLAFGDIEDGKKLKQIIKHILSIFVVIWSTAVMLKFYFLYNSWITDNFTDSSYTILKLVLLVGGSMAVIDGPNIIEKVLGVDAGLKSSFGAVMGAASGAKVAGVAAGGFALKYGPKIAQGGLNAGAMAAGGISAAMKKGNAGNKSNINTNSSKGNKTNSSSSSGENRSKGVGGSGSRISKQNGSNSAHSSGNGIEDTSDSSSSSSGGSVLGNAEGIGNSIGGDTDGGSSFDSDGAELGNGGPSSADAKIPINESGNNRTTDMTFDDTKNKVSKNKVISSVHRHYDIGYNAIDKWKNNRKDKK